jgi:hypothetical protein
VLGNLSACFRGEELPRHSDGRCKQAATEKLNFAPLFGAVGGEVCHVLRDKLGYLHLVQMIPNEGWEQVSKEVIEFPTHELGHLDHHPLAGATGTSKVAFDFACTTAEAGSTLPDLLGSYPAVIGKGPLAAFGGWLFSGFEAFIRVGAVGVCVDRV